LYVCKSSLTYGGEGYRFQVSGVSCK